VVKADQHVTASIGCSRGTALGFRRVCRHSTRSRDACCAWPHATATPPQQWRRQRWTSGQRTPWTPRSARTSTASSPRYAWPTCSVPWLTCVQLGGIGDDGTYALGDDALLCLKDLRKWLKFGDGQLNRRDVARCMAEANLINGDLLEILAKIAPRVLEDKWRHKLAVATCKWQDMRSRPR
jgi:hypothetical protein